MNNAQNRGIFYVINCGGHDDKSITRINAQFVEMDDLSFKDQQERIDAFPLPPSMIIKTRKSLHTYWFMKGAKVDRFRDIQKGLVKHFNGDPMCINESRVLRLPGFNHCKEDPIMVACVSFHPERRYTQDQLATVLPEIEQKPLEVKQGVEKGLDIITHGCEFITHCRDNAPTLPEHDWYAMITNLAPFKGGTDLIHSLSALYPGYSYRNTQKKMNHFIEGGTRPMTCKTVAEKGFKCPKLLSGECKSKAPAALCYLPIGLDGIRELVAGLKVSGDVMKDIQTAKAFIETYLYNQDVVIAEAVINSQLKSHFKFTNAFLKPLSLVYKETSKTYKANAKLKKQQAETSGIPTWYELTERGFKFLPGVLAGQMASSENVFYAAEQHFAYQDGVYNEISEMEAQRLVQEKMITRETRMSQIVDAGNQWKLHIQKDIHELNSNPYIINVKNGLYNILEEMAYEASQKSFR